MKYIKVRWIHQFDDEPIELFLELDDFRNEIRKIEVYRDNSIGYATDNLEVGGSRISEEPIPELEEIALDKQFEPVEINKAEFENLWNKYVLSKSFSIFQK